MFRVEEQRATLWVSTYGYRSAQGSDLSIQSYMMFLVLSAAASLFIFVRARNRNAAERCVAALLPVALLQAIVGVTNRIHESPFIKWNEARIAPSMGLRLGYPLYPGPDGIITGHAYGPITALAYLPATLAPNPTLILLFGSITSLLLTCAPVVWLLFRTQKDKSAAAPMAKYVLLLLFLFFSLFNDALAYSMYNIHADAPSLGFGALACCVLLSDSIRQQFVKFGLVALFASLAVWSKQNLAPLFIALPIYMVLIRDWKTGFVLAAYMGAGVLLLSAVMVYFFGPFSNLYYYMFELSAHVPRFLNSVADVCGPLLAMVEMAAIPMAVCIFVTLQDAASDAAWSVRRFLAGREATVFLLAACFNFPTSFVGIAKAGGDVNSHSFFVYYLAVAALIYIKNELDSLTVATLPVQFEIAMPVALFLCCANQATRSFVDLRDQPDLYQNNSQLAYEYAKSHPHDAFFPWDPLVGLLADGRYYHFEHGVYDRFLAQKQLTEEEYLKGVPDSFNYIIFPERRPIDPTPSLFYLKEYSKEMGSAKYPGWHIYMRPTPAKP